MFEFRSAGRVFIFTAESSADMKRYHFPALLAQLAIYHNIMCILILNRWIQTLEDGVAGAKRLLHRKEVALVASVTPEKLRLFDEKV